MSDLDRLCLRKLIVQATTLHRRNLVLRVRTAYLIRPLHLFCLDHQTADLLFAVLQGREGDNEVGTILTVGLEHSLARVHGELGCRIVREVCLEVGWLLHVVSQTERDT